MRIGEAVRQHIEELCQQQNLTVNKLSNISGVTQHRQQYCQWSESQCNDLHNQKAVRWFWYHNTGIL